MTSTPILVTDRAVVAASGVGVEAAWRCVEDGRSCIGPVRSFDARAFDGALGGELLDLPEHAGEQDRATRLLLTAADGLDAGLRELLTTDRDASRRTALVLGTSKGVVLAMADVHRRAAGGPITLTDDDVAAIEAYRPGWGTDRLAHALGVEGPRSTLALACASSSMAILHGASMIRRGLVDRAVVGGFDGFSPFVFSGFHAIGALSATGCRPFDRRRDGTVLGEAAALLVLETAESAKRRGATAFATYEGGGYAADGVHLTAPDREGRGLGRALRQALRDAGTTPGEVDYVNAHGTATRYNDAMECRAFADLFEPAGSVPPISSCKSVFGHTLGAAGALDAIVSIEALRRGVLPPTVDGGEEPEVEGWDFVPGRGRPEPSLARALTTNSGFGGNNTALLFGRADRATIARPVSRPQVDVVVSGLGVVTWSGEGPERLTRLDESPTPPREIAEPGVEVPFGRIDRIKRHPFQARFKKMSQLDAFSQYAFVAAIHAFDDAGLEVPSPEAEELGAMVGSAFGCQEANAIFDRFTLDPKTGPDGVRPAVFKNTVDNVPAGWIALGAEVRGVNATWVGGPAAGAESVLAAVWALESGRAAQVVAGGVDRVIPLQVAARHRRAEPPSPYGAEGGAMLFLETSEQARGRGASPRASLLAASRLEAGVETLARWLHRQGHALEDLAEVSLVADDPTARRAIADGLGRKERPLRIDCAQTGDTFAAQGPLALCALVVRLHAGATGLLVVDGESDEWLVFLVEGCTRR